MAKKTDSDNDNGIIRQFNELKKKHPDAMLLSDGTVSMNSISRMPSRLPQCLPSRLQTGCCRTTRDL
mgnify:CR=1 FL=1